MNIKNKITKKASKGDQIILYSNLEFKIPNKIQRVITNHKFAALDKSNHWYSSLEYAKYKYSQLSRESQAQLFTIIIGESHIHEILFRQFLSHNLNNTQNVEKTQIAVLIIEPNKTNKLLLFLHPKCWSEILIFHLKSIWLLSISNTDSLLLEFLESTAFIGSVEMLRCYYKISVFQITLGIQTERNERAISL